jgi:carboxylesterase type B
MKTLSPNTPEKVSDYILNVLYPPVYDGSHGYKDSIERTSLSIADLIFRCNTDYLSRAFYGDIYAYEFSIPPALHGQDVAYTFFNKGAEGIANVTVALAMQDYFTSFIQHGAPKSQLGPVFKMRGKDAQLVKIGNHTIQPVQDPTDSERCRFWQTAPYHKPT